MPFQKISPWAFSWTTQEIISPFIWKNTHYIRTHLKIFYKYRWPFDKMIYRWNYEFNKNCLCCRLKRSDTITTQFCPCQDNVVVLKCANLCCDWNDRAEDKLTFICLKSYGNFTAGQASSLLSWKVSARCLINDVKLWSSFCCAHKYSVESTIDQTMKLDVIPSYGAPANVWASCAFYIQSVAECNPGHSHRAHVIAT